MHSRQMVQEYIGIWPPKVRNNILKGATLKSPFCPALLVTLHRSALHCWSPSIVLPYTVGHPPSYAWTLRTSDMWNNLTKSKHVPYSKSLPQLDTEFFLTLHENISSRTVLDGASKEGRNDQKDYKPCTISGSQEV